MSNATELKYQKPKEEIYIPLMNFNLQWYRSEVNRVIKLWKYGDTMKEIADKMNRDIDEVTVLIIDLAREGKIERRGTR